MKKLFTNDKFFLVTVLTGVIGRILHAIGLLIFWPDYAISGVGSLIGCLCMAVLYVSYKKHSKNVMKGLMGAVLMSSLLYAVSMVPVSEKYIVADRVCTYINLALVAFLFVNHYIINSDRHSRSANIMMNKLCVFVLAINSVIWCLVWVTYPIYFWNVAFQLMDAIAAPCLLVSIISIESRLDAYKLDREAAGWTEEKGYPEGYMHEYEKTK